MIEAYLREQKSRTEFVQNIQHDVITVLADPRAKKVLGPLAITLTILARDMYIPDVSQHGMISIPAQKRGSDALPVLALRQGEQVVRDASFAGFTPQQLATTPDDQKRYFQMVCKRTEDLPQQKFATYLDDPGEASVRRMVHCIPEFPTADKSTYFNMRPLLLLNYPESGRPLRANKVGAALTMADFVMENAVVTTQGVGGFDLVNTDWSEQAGAVAEALQRVQPA